MIGNKNDKNNIIITFQNETQLLKLDRFIAKKYAYKIIPIPRKISAGCGLCIKTNAENKNDLTKIIQDNNIKFENIIEM